MRDRAKLRRIPPLKVSSLCLLASISSFEDKGAVLALSTHLSVPGEVPRRKGRLMGEVGLHLWKVSCYSTVSAYKPDVLVSPRGIQSIIDSNCLGSLRTAALVFL